MKILLETFFGIVFIGIIIACLPTIMGLFSLCVIAYFIYQAAKSLIEGETEKTDAGHDGWEPDSKQDRSAEWQSVQDKQKSETERKQNSYSGYSSSYRSSGYGTFEDYGEGCKWMRKAVLNGSKVALRSLNKWNRENRGTEYECDINELKDIELGLEEDHTFLPPIIIPKGLDLHPYHMDLRHGIMKWRFAAENNTDTLWREFYESDFHETLRDAEEGNAEKQYQLAWLYSWGQGTVQNNLKAIEWFVRSAYNGYARAQTELGILYQYRVCGMVHSSTDHDYALPKEDSSGNHK